MTEAKNTVWTLVRGKGSKEPILIGRKISPEWLKEKISLIEVRFGGDMFRALNDLLTLAKAGKKNLPVVALRTALVAGIENIVNMDRDLGLIPGNDGTAPPAISMYPTADDDRDELRNQVANYVRRWVMDELDPWAERNGMGSVVVRVKNAVDAANIELTDVSSPFIRPGDGRPNYPLIARAIAERLVGEALFEGLGCCELVASPESKGNHIELMTPPIKASRGDDVFSMVARLTVCSMPYSSDVLLGVSTMKRVWAKRVPLANARMPQRVTGYVMAAGRPVMMVPVERHDGAWEFGDGYAAAQREANGALPATLQDAVSQRDFDAQTGWWAGLPELPTLFKFVSPRTVFEADEVSLLNTITPLLGSLLVSKPLPVREISLGRMQTKMRQEMLRLADLDFGTAGDFLFSEGENEDGEEAQEEAGGDRSKNLQHYRDQNIRALTLEHGEKRPVLWVLGGTPIEKELIESSVKTLFGDAVTVNLEPLPVGTHGLRAELDGSSLTARSRFEERVKRWQAVTPHIQSISGDRPVIALICAADKYLNKAEDPVNYYAGIHALSSIGANVHHVLPIENPDEDASKQAFLHRTQSALLDVFLAHSGIVFGVKDFVGRLMPVDATPYAVYGIQAIRSRARNRSGETGVTFILYSRLVVETGVTEVQFVYRQNGSSRRSDWMPLAKGLQWLGSHRQMHEGDERWLRDAFATATRDTLVSIHENDPFAVVMIDWSSVAGLWKGIRDEDLAPGGSPKLGNVNLSAFDRMSFVRIRRGADTLSLRASVKTTYEGWQDDGRLRTGETMVDAYFTTNKSLVEVTDEVLASDKPCGHFIATMGYAKTVQVKRGFSCYRPMPRMNRVAKGGKEFQQKTLDPASLDAALPAPMDITVMSTPVGIAPKNIAMLVMGLRLGYAHYNDWTTLPAPMFFRRKIEDYVIRFPEEEESVIVADSGEEGAVETFKPVTRIARLLQEESKPQPVVETVEETVPDQVKMPTPEIDELLAQAQATEMPVLFTAKDVNHRALIKRIIQDDHAVRVQVDLPYWIKTHGIFGQFNATVRRNAARCWKHLRSFSYVRSKDSMPRESEFLNWLAERLRIPQAAHALAPMCGDIGGLSFVRFRDVVNETYNVNRPKEEVIKASFLTPEHLEALTEWANENNQDELLGWLIFQVAQFPNTGWCEAVLGSITKIPGPMTEEALKYYLDVAYAVEAAIAQKDHISKFQPVIVRRAKPDIRVPVAHTPIEIKAAVQEIGQEAIAVCEAVVAPAPEVSDSIVTHSPNEGCPVMAIKNKLSDLIQRVTPGTESYFDLLSEINNHLEALTAIHRHELEKNSQAAIVQQRLDALKKRCEELIALLYAMKEELDIGEVKYVEPEEGLIDAAEEGVSAIQASIDDILALNSQIETLQQMPPATKFEEKQKRSRIINDAYENIISISQDLKGLLSKSSCLVASFGTPTPDGSGPGGEPVSEAPAVEQVTEPASAPAEEVIAAVAESVVEPTLTVEQVAPATPVVEVAPAQSVVEPVPAEQVIEPVIESVEEVLVEFPLVTQVAPIEIPVVVAAKVVAPVSQIDDAQNEASDDERFEASHADPVEIDREAGVLHQLLRQRLYGLAEVHVAAMKPSLEMLGDGGINSHYVILKALVDSLYRMDCQFEFDPKMNADLKDMLSAYPLSSDDLCDSSHAALGVLAAGLSSMLFDSSGGQWSVGNAISSRLVGFPALIRLIEHIDMIRQRNLILTRDMFLISHIGDQKAIDQELERFRQRASEWKTSHEIYSNWNHRGFRALHDEMFHPKSIIGQCLALIAKGESEKVAVAYEEARRKFEKPAATIDEMYKKIGERTKPDGMYRGRAIENVEITRRFIESYLEHKQRREKPNHELVRSTQAFLANLHRYLDEAVVEIASIETSTELSGLYLEAARSAIYCARRLFDNNRPAVCVPQNKQKLLIQFPMNRDLMPSMDKIDDQTPELCRPADVLNETGRWSKEASLLDGYDENIDVALQEAMSLHIDSQRFLPAFHIEALLPRGMAPGEPLMQIYNRKKTSFKAELQEARQRVTHAMTLDALPQNEAPVMLRVIEEMLASLASDRSIGHPEGAATYPDFPHAKAALRHNVLIPLNARLSEAMARLEARLQECSEKYGISVAQDVQRIRAMLVNDNAASLRTAHDAIAILNQTGRLPGRIGGPVDIASAYDTFVHTVHRDIGGHKNPLEALRDRLLKPVEDDDPAWLKPLDEEQRTEGAQLLSAWIDLFANGRRAVGEDCKPLVKVFQMFGIGHAPTPHPEHGRPNRARFMVPERAFTFPSMADDDMFIPPALGSWATHIQGFMLYGAPQENDLRQLMQEVGGTPTVVMARVRLNMQKRMRISGSSPVLLIDDELVAYVALNPGERLQALMRIAVMSFGTNPYDDYGGRPVPSEMFFGRQVELSKLREVKSLGVLFGGRRLGKSSLLSQIERETTQTEGSAAVYVSMETVNSSSNHVTAAWEFIYRSLLSRRIISAMPASVSRWQSIRDWIDKELVQHKTLKSLYLLIDEADALMGCELKLGKSEIGFIRGLQQMIDNVHHAIPVRYVIAGLHNMTRMTTEENSVFGKADPIALEPFSSPDDIQRGIRLITKPLAAMGFLFGEGTEDLPLRILSVCNFYPAFIQLYCKRLVDRLQNNRQDTKPPLYITACDLDAVESDNSLLTELRRKFELNLNLDKRYKAIALILAEIYYSEIEKGHYQGLTTKEISNYCEEFAGSHFAHTGPGVYEALLDEMCKLNVLERVGTRYVLRNPNIAMMMGDRERVITQLDELAKEPPEESRNHGEKRIYMEYQNTRQLFPFPVAWSRRYLDPTDGELLVVTGNDLSGLHDIMRPPGKEEWRIGHDGWFSMLSGSGPMAAQELLNRTRRGGNDRMPRFVAVRQNSWSIQQIGEFAAIAQKAAKVGIRFLLLALPERAYEIAAAIDAGRLGPTVEQGSWRVVPIPQWTEDAIFFRLNENIEVAENSRAIAAILEASCGFNKEVLTVCSNNLTVSAALNAPKERKAVLAPNIGEFYRKIGLPPAFSAERRSVLHDFLSSINGGNKQSSEVEELREMLGVTQGEMDFMYWMGLLQDGPSGTWMIPAMYLEMIR